VEARLARTGQGLAPQGEGWYVLNARDTRWFEREGLSRICEFEPDDVPFPELGVNLGVVQPGRPNGMYHREEAQEAYLILSGEALLLVEGEERPLRAWDFVHLPAGTDHILVGAGSRPCVFLAVGTRAEGGAQAPVVYPVAEVAQRHDAGVFEETREAKQAYARFPAWAPQGLPEGALPEP
jgi:uncharacterized cupin superfamily protein